jgi:lysophospholipase L1-like esterase
MRTKDVCGAVVSVVVLLSGLAAGQLRSAAATSVTPPAAGSRYVALGSSFASGYGIAKQQTSCGRSTHNYGHLVAAHFHLHLTDVTCAGATTANVRVQARAVTAKTSLITITAGGNDVNYSLDTLICQEPGNCLKTLDKKSINTGFAALPRRLESIVSLVQARAPHAMIVLVTYPEVVPANGASCKSLSLSAPEAKYIHGMGQRLENVFLQVAKARPDVILVDPYAKSAGHGACASPSKRWVAGVHAPNGFQDHPTLLWHQRMAKWISAAL